MRIFFGAVVYIIVLLNTSFKLCSTAKINTPRVLLPWFENAFVSFTFEIIEGGCYSWSLSRDDIIDIEPIYEDSWGHCSRAARVSVSKLCVPPGSVIILAEEVNTGEVLRGDVDIDVIKSLKVISTTWKLYLEEAPEAFEVVALDEQGNTFSTLEGVSFNWTVVNVGNNYGEDPLVSLVRWKDTDYEAPHGIAELEANGLRSYSVLLYGQAMGEARVEVCLHKICANFDLNVVASVVLMPASATIAPGDTLRFKVVRVRAGRLSIEDVSETLYHIQVPDSEIAALEDGVSLVRGRTLGQTTVKLISGASEVATSVLTVAEPHSIKVTIRPSSLVIQDEPFKIQCTVLDANGHHFTAGDETLIRLVVDGGARVELIKSTDNGTITDAIALNTGTFNVFATLYSVGKKIIRTQVEGRTSGIAVEPLQVVPPELYIAWTDNVMEVPLKHRGGGDELVTWAATDEQKKHGLSLSNTGVMTVTGAGDMGVKVQLKKYTHVRAYGRVWSAVPEYIQVQSSGQARVGKPHHLHVALTGTHPETGELFNFNRCDCSSFSVTVMEGPEPVNITAAPHVMPAEGGCCVLSLSWTSRGTAAVRVWRGRAGDAARVRVRGAPVVTWPEHAALRVGETLPILAMGESLVPQSSDSRLAELTVRDGAPPHRYPEMQLFTLKCNKKGESTVSVVSESEEDSESAVLETACVPLVSRIRLDAPESPANCSGGPRLWLRPGRETKLRLTMFDAIGREILEERGPRATWEISPKHKGIEYRATDRLFIEMHPEYAPVPVPYKYYQILAAEDKAVGWSGSIKVNIPEATATIQAKVVAPLHCEPSRANIAWEGDTVSPIAVVTGGSGRYIVEAAKGVVANVEDAQLKAAVPGPGLYEMVVSDACVSDERIVVEVNIEEILSIEVSTARAVCVDTCIPISALVRGVSHRYVTSSRKPEWRVSGDVVVREDMLCGVREGSGRVRAGQGGIWSTEIEIAVFPVLRLVPDRIRIPVGARYQLHHEGGPSHRFATLHYQSSDKHIETSPSGLVIGLSMGTARVKLTANDYGNEEMASAEAIIEVIPITSPRIVAATQSLLVGSPAPLWLASDSLSPAILASLRPAPKLHWTVRDPASARLYSTHVDDYIERSTAEGLSVRVVPLKPGIITIDVRVRNLGQLSENRDIVLEILAISDIRTSIEGHPEEISPSERLSLAVGSTVRLAPSIRAEWVSYSEGVIELSSNGEVKAIKPGFGVIVAQNNDEKNGIYRQAVIHVEVSIPHYCTVEPNSDDEDDAVKVVLRNSIGRELIAPTANVSVYPSTGVHVRPSAYVALGPELLITGLDGTGSLMTVQATASGVTVTDEVLIVGSDRTSDRIIATGGWLVCVAGADWRWPSGVSAAAAGDVTAVVLPRATAARHSLRAERPPRHVLIHQLAVEKMEFIPGEWSPSFIPLITTAAGLHGTPVLCSEQQRYQLVGLELELPFVCHTQLPYSAEPAVDFVEGQIGCKVISDYPITEASDIEVCAEFASFRACTQVSLLPQVALSTTKVSLLETPTTFTVLGHHRALKFIKLTVSPGLKLETNLKGGELQVIVTSEEMACGIGWVNVFSKLTGQDLRVEVDKNCEIACGTLLEAIISLIIPYVPTLVAMACVFAAFSYVQSRYPMKSRLNLPTKPVETVLSPLTASPLNRSTRPRSPYSADGPASPVYGDASLIQDTSLFEQNYTRPHSRFL